ncbi:hypothetical protein NL514_33430, partial [Klebsiella pneumoniae]|nr:hypothetical protein [Klebsiella pneumoniae]
MKPKKASGKGNQERKGPFFVQHSDGKIGELSTESELKAHLDAGYKEINKVEYLQLQEAAAENKTQTEDS